MKKFADIKNGSKVALDTVLLIYFLEKNPLFYQQAREVFLRVEQGEIQACMSSLVFAELLVPAYRSNEDKNAQETIRILSIFPNLQILPVSTEISAMAAKLRARHGLRTPDAIHAAGALINKADYLLTNDRDFSKIEGKLEVLYC